MIRCPHRCLTYHTGEFGYQFVDWFQLMGLMGYHHFPGTGGANDSIFGSFMLNGRFIISIGWPYAVSLEAGAGAYVTAGLVHPGVQAGFRFRRATSESLMLQLGTVYHIVFDGIPSQFITAELGIDWRF